jgi:hypothetical protein
VNFSFYSNANQYHTGSQRLPYIWTTGAPLGLRSYRRRCSIVLPNYTKGPRASCDVIDEYVVEIIERRAPSQGKKTYLYSLRTLVRRC